jgi:integrase/recombinase XerD
MKPKTRNQTNNSLFDPPGYLKQYLDGFISDLFTNGYSELTIHSYRSSILHFSTWLNKENISLENITDKVVPKFGQHECYCCSDHHKKNQLGRRYLNRIYRFIDYLNQQGIIVINAPIQKTHPLYLAKFRESLHARGLSIKTIEHYECNLCILVSLLGDEPKEYNAISIRKTVCDAAMRNSRAMVRKLTTVLRVYLRFLSMNGHCRSNLDLSVPTVAEWRLSSLPKYIMANEIERLIASCDTHTHQGLRDRSIILLLSRLGLRAGDIINMKMEDINWEESTLCVKGKGRKEVLLPLPQEMGDALLAYLEKARPIVNIENIFLCLNAPYRSFPCSGGISSIVSAALYRAGINNPPSRGASLLRHSAATNMLRNGATLETVLAVLRHQSLDMTGYYAKVDFSQLMRIAQPWPEGAPC